MHRKGQNSKGVVNILRRKMGKKKKPMGSNESFPTTISQNFPITWHC